MTKHYYAIVVAEDDPAINSLVSDLLRDEGYEVHSCVSGVEALQVIARVQPDLVIADVQMETRDAGLRLLAQLRADPATARIAVILCSADAFTVRRHTPELTRLSATVLPKPFGLDELVSTVRKVLLPTQDTS